MELTQQLRDFAAEKGLSEEEAVAAGLAEKAQEFREQELVQLGATKG
jgi:phosphomethylpyrimidine synthase